MNVFQLEVIAFTIESCQQIEQAGAHRIELCDNPGEGGTTPSYGMIHAARKVTNIPLYVMIRPRGGDFLYSDAEWEIMRHDVAVCKRAGCDGIVTGMLCANGAIDLERTKQLVDIAYPMGVTFHRAFDRVPDPLVALETVIDAGCERILTSGLMPTAVEGAALIHKLIQSAAGRITIMPGSGVRSSNISELRQKTGATEFHTSARCFQNGGMMYQNPALSENLKIIGVDAAEISTCIRQLAAFSS